MAAAVLRWASLAAAGAVSLLLLAAPQLIGRTMTPLAHTLLPLALFGVSGGFVTGIGFTPDRRLWRVLLGPFVAWPAMALYPLLVALA
jgi:predicted membrane protein